MTRTARSRPAPSRRRWRRSTAPARSCSARARGAARARCGSCARSPLAPASPLLLDADGLNAHAGALEALASRGAPTVLTPHAGELGAPARRLERRGRPAPPAQRARGGPPRATPSSCSRATTRSSRAPDGVAAVNDLSAPALATAGTGDVLSGVIGAYLAKGLDPFAAACAGVRRHAAAGRVAAAEHGPDGVIASDVVAALPRALQGEPAEPGE